MQYNTQTHQQRANETSAGFCTHDNDKLVENTMCNHLWRWWCDLFARNLLSVTTQKQQKYVTFTGYRHLSLSGRVFMNGSWRTCDIIMAHTHIWT